MTMTAEPRALIELLHENRQGVYFRVGREAIVKYLRKFRVFMCTQCGKSDCPHSRVLAESDEGKSLIQPRS
jgi:hypothetical protein